MFFWHASIIVLAKVNCDGIKKALIELDWTKCACEHVDAGSYNQTANHSGIGEIKSHKVLLKMT